MKKKTIGFSVLIITLSLSTMLGCGIGAASTTIKSQAESSLYQLTEAYAQGYRESSTKLTVSDPSVRETIIASDGTVLLDSQAVSDQNHLSRPEIQTAPFVGETKGKIYSRRSETIGIDYLYYAVKVPSSSDPRGFVYLRVALRLSSFASFLNSYVPWMILVFLLTLGASIGLSFLLVSKSTEPLKKVKGQLDDVLSGKPLPPEEISKDPDFQPILADISSLAEQLQKTMGSFQEERNRLKLVLDHVQDGILALDEKGNILFCNPSASSLFDLNPDLPHRDADLGIGSLLDSLFKKGPSSNAEFEKGGSTFLLTYTSSPEIRLLVFTDVTAEKQQSKMRKEFFDSASHELKTPLTSIMGFNELIALKEKDPDVLAYSSSIAKEAKRMLGLVSEMLSLSKMESEELPPLASPTPLAPIAEEALSDLSAFAQEKDVALSVSGEGSLPLSPQEAYSVLKNLLENAIRYNKKGGWAKLILFPNGFSCQDNGIGIASKDQKRVFERFYRVDKSRSRESGGTGLGLAIVKHICEARNGEIKLLSKLGKGTTITITFSALP